MIVLFFGSDSCMDCMVAFILLNKYGIDYEYTDAFDNDESVQLFCDFHEVDALPRIKFIDEENGKIFIDHVGHINEELMISYLRKKDELGIK